MAFQAGQTGDGLGRVWGVSGEGLTRFFGVSPRYFMLAIFKKLNQRGCTAMKKTFHLIIRTVKSNKISTLFIVVSTLILLIPQSNDICLRLFISLLAASILNFSINFSRLNNNLSYAEEILLTISKFGLLIQAALNGYRANFKIDELVNIKSDEKDSLIYREIESRIIANKFNTFRYLDKFVKNYTGLIIISPYIPESILTKIISFKISFDKISTLHHYLDDIPKEQLHEKMQMGKVPYNGEEMINILKEVGMSYNELVRECNNFYDPIL